jgi:triacylglycerol lipase
MLARLQQGIVGVALLLVALLLVWGWRSGHWTWPLLGIGLVLLGHAAALASEFVCLRLTHGDDPAPKASWAQLARAWWGETLMAPVVFWWRQPFCSRRWLDHLPATPNGQRGVLLVHGFVCNRGLWNPWLEKLHAGRVPVVAVNLEPVFGSIDAYIPVIEAAVQKLEAATGWRYATAWGASRCTAGGPSGVTTRGCTMPSRSAHRTTAPGWRALRSAPMPNRCSGFQPGSKRW